MSFDAEAARAGFCFFMVLFWIKAFVMAAREAR